MLTKILLPRQVEVPIPLPPPRREGNDPYAPRIPPLDDLAMAVRRLNYGDHMTFCRSTGADPDILWHWAVQRA